MKHTKHGNDEGRDDLYILPESRVEEDGIRKFLNDNKVSYKMSMSDAQGPDWYGRQFFDLRFGEVWLPKIKTLERRINAGS